MLLNQFHKHFAKYQNGVMSPTIKFILILSLLCQPLGQAVLANESGSETALFGAEAWRKTFSGTRLDVLGAFLRDYDLIGMSEKRVISLLGWADWEPADYTGALLTAAYTIENTGCTPAGHLEIQINFDGGKVTSWCFVRGRFLRNTGGASTPITDNVLLCAPRNLGNGNIRTGLYSSSAATFPDVQLKYPPTPVKRDVLPDNTLP
jgi:hypothetical protein